MPRFEFLPGIQEEITDAYIWYESKTVGLGDDFIRELESAYASIQALPEAWPPVSRRYRKFLLHRFPYAVVYSVHRDKIVIAAVMHLRRRPDYWRKRVT